MLLITYFPGNRLSSFKQMTLNCTPTHQGEKIESKEKLFFSHFFSFLQGTWNKSRRRFVRHEIMNHVNFLIPLDHILYEFAFMIQVILFEIDCTIFYTNLYDLLLFVISKGKRPRCLCLLKLQNVLNKVAACSEL